MIGYAIAFALFVAVGEAVLQSAIAAAVGTFPEAVFENTTYVC